MNLTSNIFKTIASIGALVAAITVMIELVNAIYKAMGTRGVIFSISCTVAICSYFISKIHEDNNEKEQKS